MRFAYWKKQDDASGALCNVQIMFNKDFSRSMKKFFAASSAFLSQCKFRSPSKDKTRRRRSKLSSAFNLGKIVNGSLTKQNARLFL